MPNDSKWDYILQIEEELLHGGVILSEWSTFLARDAETAFCSDANLACILAAQAAIESHLRYEYFDPQQSKGWGLYQLINNLNVFVEPDLVNDLHKIRIFRNKWVHVTDPSDDEELLNKPQYVSDQLEEMAKLAIRSMLRVLFLEQSI